MDYRHSAEWRVSGTRAISRPNLLFTGCSDIGVRVAYYARSEKAVADVSTRRRLFFSLRVQREQPDISDEAFEANGFIIRMMQTVWDNKLDPLFSHLSELIFGNSFLQRQQMLFLDTIGPEAPSDPVVRRRPQSPQERACEVASDDADFRRAVGGIAA